MSECLFCRIAARQIPAEIVDENPAALAFNDIHPQAPLHILIIPKSHIAAISELTDATAPVMTTMILMATQLAKRHPAAQAGYRVVVNCGPQAGQSVDHLHLHLLGGRRLTWPPG